ncbi:MAG: hypothetical protein KF802_10655 [Bdellovibrionaceae bacterium]|nr:hypothetical protein [Pseudobdellovibrionaceae bacterium]
MTASFTLLWICKWVSLAALLQTLEFFFMRPAFQESGVWRWSLIRRDFISWPRWIRSPLDLLLGDRGFDAVLGARFLAAAGLLFLPRLSPLLLLILLFSTLLICVRWRGPFNGGSDSMTVLLLLVLGVVSWNPGDPVWARAALWYIALQTCFSFLIAGLVKIRHASWRNGEALQGILRLPTYEIPPAARRLADFPRFCRASSWALLLFECSFPLALLHPLSAVFYLCAAVAFQLANFYVFGLNRFVWAWLAAYPAVLWCSGGI